MGSAVGAVTGGLGIANSLFGGKKKTTYSNAYSQLPSNIQSLLDQYLSKGQKLAKSGAATYEGQQIAGLSPLEQQAVGYAQGAAQTGSQVGQQAGGVLSNLLSSARTSSYI